MPRRERPGRADDSEDTGASAQEVLEATLPLVVKAVVDGAAAMTAAASAVSSLEGTIEGLKGKVGELDRTVATLKKADIAVAKEKAAEARAWSDLFREVVKVLLSPQVLAAIVSQVIVTVLTGLGLWTVLPDSAKLAITQPALIEQAAPAEKKEQNSQERGMAPVP